MLTSVSLFAGAGGLDLGLKNAGIKTIWANDFNKDACNTHRLWSDAEVVEGDISKISTDMIPDSDIIVGGFPCQGFSLAGPRKLDDRRNVLYREFVRIVKIKQPQYFIAENVKGLLTLGDGLIWQAIISDFSDIGYEVKYKVVNAKDYGVPQDRIRVIIIGVRKDIGDNTVFDCFKEAEKKTVMEDVLLQLPEPDKSDICVAPYSSRFMSRNRKRNYDEVSFTIPAMAKQTPLHPSSPDMIKREPDVWEFGEGITRRLSYKECAAIQTFPAQMEFCGNLISKYKQIGNAVPVKLGEKIGEAIISFRSLHKMIVL